MGLDAPDLARFLIFRQPRPVLDERLGDRGVARDRPYVRAHLLEGGGHNPTNPAATHHQEPRGSGRCFRHVSEIAGHFGGPPPARRAGVKWPVLTDVGYFGIRSACKA